MGSDDELAKPLEAFVSFPSPYTQSLLVKALVKTIPSLKLSLAPFPEGHPPALQWADYDLMDFEAAHKHPSTHQTSSYIYRKALIRKHFLHKVIQEYLAKCRHRGVRSALENGGIPQGWVVDLQFADELDELLVDDLYELKEAMEVNEALVEAERKWFILKPGFADRGQGIRMFSTEAELRAIFDEFEPESDDEVEDDEDADELSDQTDRLALDKEEEDGDEEEETTGVMTSQLRHFVIQEYMPRLFLFDLSETAGQPPTTPLVGHKFHLRAYVLVNATYTVHVAKTMLALFSVEQYTTPTSESGEMDLRPHLTNTCLQSDAFGAPMTSEHLVKTFDELEGLTALDSQGKPIGSVTREWLDSTFAAVGEVVGESIKAGVECGSFALQLVPNAFEIFGVDLLVSGDLNAPTVTLLEYNASPDFHQSGDRLRPELEQMFQGVVHLCIAPFFNLNLEDQNNSTNSWVQVGSGATRGGAGWL